MVNIILISHGAFCEGLLSSLQMIAGDTYGVKAVSLIPGESPEAYREKLSLVLEGFCGEDDSGTVILSDIAGGTPYLSAAYLAKKYKIGLVSGMNMPMLLSLALERGEDTTLEQLVEKDVSSSSIGVKAQLFKEGEKKQRAKLSINKNR